MSTSPAPIQSSKSKTLERRERSGSAEAVARVEPSFTVRDFYRRYSRTVVAAIRRLFGSGPPDPEDVMHLAFQKLMEYPNPENIRNPEAFLWRTARNLVVNEKRSRSIRDRYEYEVERIYFTDRGDNIDAERVVTAKEQVSAINEALLAMPERRRRSFMLHRVDGYSVSEVARQLGISRTAAHKHIRRALTDLDELLHGLN